MRKELNNFALLILITSLMIGCSSSTASPTGDIAVQPPGTTTSTSTPTAASEPQSITDEAGLYWWNEDVFYEIFVRSYLDSDDDGDGDFIGLIDELDYLNDHDPDTSGDLGVHSLWLMPIFPSPSYHGYDVIDYYNVNPDYGTLDDFRRFMDEAHQRGIRVIIDMPLNHTSSQHPWFIESQKPDSAYRDWYIWSDTDPGMIGPWGQQVWHSGATGYYYGVFWGGMPDLNYRNPEVTEEMENIFRFWLEDVGVDGFRLDGARYIVEEGDELADSEANLHFFEDMRSFVKDINPDALLLGEVWTSNFAAASYLKREALDLVFDFDLASAFMSSAGSGRAESALNQLKFSLKLFPPGQFAPFLTNHDMNRVMSQLGGDVEKAKNAATMLLTSPGVPFVYYGEEIGMLGQKPDERIRTPMQWSPEEHAGFTTGVPWQSVNPDYPEKNVVLQSTDHDSLLYFYNSLVRIRNQSEALRFGDTYLIESQAPGVYSILRAYEDDLVLVVLNLGNEEVNDFGLNLLSGPLEGNYQVVSLIEDGQYAELISSDTGGFEDYQPLPTLPPYARLILQLK